MLRVFATFLKKGSAKNFPTGKVLGYFSKIVRSTEICSRLSVFNYAVGVCGFKFDGTMPEFKSFLFRFFQKNEWGLGQRPIKTAFSFCKAFSFAPFVPKEKAMLG